MPSTIVNVEDPDPNLNFGAVGDGEHDDQNALQAAFDAAENGILLFPDSSKTYAIHGFGLKIREGTRIINAGAVLLIRGKVPADARDSAAIVAGARVQADWLRIHAARRSLINRVLTVTDDTSIERLEIVAAAQQANSAIEVPTKTGGTEKEKYHAALYVFGKRVKLGYVWVKGFDRAVFARESEHVVILRLDIQNYVTGLFLKQCAFVELVSGTIKLASKSDVGDRNIHDEVKGMNGLLIDTCSDVVVSDLIVQNSIEHGVRIGGDGPTRRCTFNSIQVRRAGWCGFKVEPPLPAGSAESIQINGLTVIDCAWPHLDDEAKPFTFEPWGGLNRCGLRLENCHGVMVSGFRVGRERKTRYSSYHGIYIDRCRNVTVIAPHVGDTFEAGIRLSDGHDSKESSPVNQIYIRDPVITFLVPEAHAPYVPHKAHGIWIHSNWQVLRDIVITGCYIRGYTGHGVLLEPAPGDGAVRQPVIIQGWVRQEGDGVFHPVPAPDSDIHNLIWVV